MKPSIEQLEKILSDDNCPPIRIMPDGSIVADGGESAQLNLKTLDWALTQPSSY